MSDIALLPVIELDSLEGFANISSLYDIPIKEEITEDELINEEINEENIVQLTSRKKELFNMYIEHGFDSDEDLHYFIKELLGYNIPNVAVCPEHDSPFQAFADFFFERVLKAIWLANRNGGKTRLASLLHNINACTKKYCEITSSGAVQEQASLCFSYLDEYKKLDFVNEHIKQALKNPLIYKYKNGSSIRIVTASKEGFNGPHPQKNIVDEVELIPWDVLQESFSMSKTSHKTTWKNQNEEINIKGQDLLTSTRKKLTGTMSRLIAKSKEMGFKVYTWCIFEIVENCPYQCSQCHPKVLERCNGKAKKAHGYYDIDDFISKARTLDDITWEAQWLCKKPSAEGLFYKEFDRALHTITIDQFKEKYEIKNNSKDITKLIPENWRKICIFDWGYADPLVFLGMVRSNTDNVIYVFKEFYRTSIKPSDVPKIWLGEKLERLEYQYDWSNIKWEVLIGDPSGKAWISEFKDNKDFIRKKFNFIKAINDLEFGYKYVREYMAYQKDIKFPRLVFIEDECFNSIIEHEELKYSDSLNTSEYPDSKCDDHTVDCVRYGCAYFAYGDINKKRKRGGAKVFKSSTH